MISDILQGCLEGQLIVSAKAMKRADPMETATIQACQIGYLCRLVAPVLSAGNFPPLPPRIDFLPFLAAVPLGLSYQWAERSDNRCAKAIASGSQRHFSSLFLALAVGSQLTLIRFGEVTRGIASLAMIGTVTVVNSYSPDSTSWPQQALGYGRCALVGLLFLRILAYGSWLAKTAALLAGGGYGIRKYFKAPPPTEPKTGGVNILDDYSKANLVVDHWHPYHYLPPPPPEYSQVNFDDFETLCDTAQFIIDQSVGEALSAKGEDFGEIIKQSMTKLANQLKGEEGGLCSLSTFKDDQKKAAQILLALQKRLPEELMLPLTQLAHAIYYPPVIAASLLNSLYQDLMTLEGPLADQINQALRPLREEALYESLKPQTQNERNWLEWNEQASVKQAGKYHLCHAATLISEGSLGTGQIDHARADFVAGIQTISLQLRSRLFGFFPWADRFWEYYSAEKIIQKVSQKRVNKIDPEKIREWVKGKLPQMTAEEEINTYLSNNVFDKEKAIKKEFVKLLLIDLGILRVTT